MESWLKSIMTSIEPVADDIYGPRYRCALILKDGTVLPCVVVQSKQRLVDLAKQRIKEEMGGRGVFRGSDAYGQIVSTFVADGNRVNDYDVASAAESSYAIPLSLLTKIHGETTMGWTGWVFRMRNGRAFSYGSPFHMEFFQLPEGYSFSDVDEVINHSFVDAAGAVVSLERGRALPSHYRPGTIFRERVFFTCPVDGL